MKKIRGKATLDNISKLITDSNEHLARMVAVGFTKQEKKITEKITETITEKITGLKSSMDQQFAGINNRIDDLALNRATREEMQVLDKRVARIELKLGLDFKKQSNLKS